LPAGAHLMSIPPPVRPIFPIFLPPGTRQPGLPWWWTPLAAAEKRPGPWIFSSGESLLSRSP
ncbi:MAG: hypothetical protein C4548_06085, partial [Desulfobacteraceae bacterium]